MNVPTQGLDRTAIEEKFIVPYDRNPKLTGRNPFIQEMREKLCTEVPRLYNYRIALHGMGGIGKTQCALEYVYSNRTSYSRIYWIPAADEASILSGYEKIAKAARLLIPLSATPRDIAAMVLTWLRSESSWLLVVDNLDDYEVARGLLPENGSERHTLITTRNPKTMAIPAESLEVPLLDLYDSVDLLLTLSIPGSTPSPEEKEQARLIVDELGYLPLAILQAAAFIREVTGSVLTYLNEYQKSRRNLIEWSTNDPYYPYSVATTWSMSFAVLQTTFPPAARLLQLFSLLNPDGILIDFLVDGAEGLDDELRQIVASQVEMAKVLLELEKFSLIKWNRGSKSISMHRLVQLVVNDEMSDKVRQSTTDAIIDLSTRAFPDHEDNRALCRLYESQVIKALLRLDTTRSMPAAELMTSVGIFLGDEAKFSSARELFLRAYDISNSVCGDSDTKTFELGRLVSTTDNDLGHFNIAAERLEYLLPKAEQALGNNHEETFYIRLVYGKAFIHQHRFNEAVEVFLSLVQDITRNLGADDALTLYSIQNLAIAYKGLDRWEEALDLETDSLARRRRVFGDMHTETIISSLNCTGSLLHTGRLDEAIEIGEEAMKKSKLVWGDYHLHYLAAVSNLADVYKACGKAKEAEALLEELEVLKTRMDVDARAYLEAHISRRWRLMYKEDPV